MDVLQIKTLRLLEDIIVIGINGTLDGITVPELEKTTQKYLDDKIYKFIFDLSGLNKIASAGAGFFTKMAAITSEHYGAIVLVQPVPPVREVLNIFGLMRYIPIVNDLDAAIKQLSK
ncbi:MAG: STAS domain-containing protein [Planctomycetes bacterium]|nr:STAS domain-containing protein [Planctomycetota bacterium]